MSTKLDRRDIQAALRSLQESDRSDAFAKARQTRQTLQAFATRLFTHELRVRLPPKPEDWVVQGQGHFHLVPELFLQVSGVSRFVFPHAELELEAGEVLLVPPRLLHDELVCKKQQNGQQYGEQSAPFQNLVIYVNGTALTCHIAHESAHERPEVHHLEAIHCAHAPRIHDWLADAAKIGWDLDSLHDSSLRDLAMCQLRALIATACTSVLGALNSIDSDAKQEPELVSKIRMWTKNQLGDSELSIRRLAEQAGCTPDYLSSVFRRATGESLVGFIVHQRLDRAATLLAESALSGKEIAWACGFSAQSYFVRSFHKHFGMTPKAWRNKRRADMGR